MTCEKALGFMKTCAVDALKGKLEWATNKKKTDTYQPLDELKDIDTVLDCIDYISAQYKDKITDGCAENIGYFLNSYRFPDSHSINILTTIYILLVADANIYVLYDGSFFEKDYDKSVARYFLDELLTVYERAHKITVAKEMTRFTHTVIKEFVRSHNDIKHIVDFGDFVNFYSKAVLFEELNLRVHLPAAHYVIMDYSESEISEHDTQLLISFGEKCWNGLIDYAAYASEENEHEEAYGFSICGLFFTELSMFYALEDIKHIADKVTTVIFTDKDESELRLPEGFYECCNVFLSKDYNDDILNYDFTQLLK